MPIILILSFRSTFQDVVWILVFLLTGNYLTRSSMHYFQHLSKETDLQDIYKVFSHISYDEIKSYLSTDPVMRNDTLFETVLLDEIYQSYYSGDFPKERMMAFADTIKQETRNSVIRDMADALIKKFNLLQPGQPAPGFHAEGCRG